MEIAGGGRGATSRERGSDKNGDIKKVTESILFY